VHLHAHKELGALVAQLCMHPPSSVRTGAVLQAYSFALAAWIEDMLHMHNKWVGRQWLDDLVVHRWQREGEALILWGVLIYGKQGDGGQWVVPFRFRFRIDCRSGALVPVELSTGLRHLPEVPYEDYAATRRDWDRFFRYLAMHDDVGSWLNHIMGAVN